MEQEIRTKTHSLMENNLDQAANGKINFRRSTLDQLVEEQPSQFSGEGKNFIDTELPKIVLTNTILIPSRNAGCNNEDDHTSFKNTRRPTALDSECRVETKISVERGVRTSIDLVDFMSDYKSTSLRRKGSSAVHPIESLIVPMPVNQVMNDVHMFSLEQL